MKDHLKPKPPVIAESFKLHRRNQQDGDRFAQYLAELRKLTEQYDLKEYLNEASRDRASVWVTERGYTEETLD